MGHNHTILIADDEMFIRSAFQLYFETVGYSVVVAEDGERALEIFSNRSGHIDVVILDLVMPGMHGIEVLKRFKEIDSSVEVIIATGCGSMNSAIEALRHGAYDYITKPVVNLDQDLLTVVRGALGSRQAKLQECERKEPPTPTSFYEGLETLAREPIGPENEHRVTQVVGDFLTAHLDATAVFLLYRDEGEVTFVEGWGDTQGQEFPHSVASGAQKDLLGRLEGDWKQLSASDREDLRRHKLPSAEGLEVAQIPVHLAARMPEQPVAENRAVILAFRQARTTPEPYPPGFALLGLVLGRLLEPLLAERVSSPDQDLLALAPTK